MGEHAPWPEGTIYSFSFAEQEAAGPPVGSDTPDHVKRTMSRYPSPVAAMTSFSAVVCLAGGIYLGVTEGQWWFVHMAFVLGLLAFLIYSRDRRWYQARARKHDSHGPAGTSAVGGMQVETASRQPPDAGDGPGSRSPISVASTGTKALVVVILLLGAVGFWLMDGDQSPLGAALIAVGVALMLVVRYRTTRARKTGPSRPPQDQ